MPMSTPVSFRMLMMPSTQPSMWLLGSLPIKLSSLLSLVALYLSCKGSSFSMMSKFCWASSLTSQKLSLLVKVLAFMRDCHVKVERRPVCEWVRPSDSLDCFDSLRQSGRSSAFHIMEMSRVLCSPSLSMCCCEMFSAISRSMFFRPCVTWIGLSLCTDHWTSCWKTILKRLCRACGKAMIPSACTRRGAVVALMMVVRNATPLV
mmetsp:Transcript_15377/g.32390  ORF Transcript_15377/g.32390 Transcript_15377/m.32390 type:complete len:205 (-) Transcript_15377:1110-1724(-)